MFMPLNDDRDPKPGGLAAEFTRAVNFLTGVFQEVITFAEEATRTVQRIAAGWKYAGPAPGSRHALVLLDEIRTFGKRGGDRIKWLKSQWRDLAPVFNALTDESAPAAPQDRITTIMQARGKLNRFAVVFQEIHNEALTLAHQHKQLLARLQTLSQST